MTRKYAGRFEYDQNNTFKRAATSEGQVVPSGESLRFDYFLKDHLGNVRVVFDEGGNVLQKSDYYGFGIEIDRNTPIQSIAVRNGINRYNFLGHEKQVGTGYIDLQARFYDPTIGRFLAIDPETEGQLEFSPYHYSFDNPIRFSDPDGKFPGPGSPIMGNPKHYIVEGFRQYFQAAGALVDRAFASSSTAIDTKISEEKATTTSGTLKVTTSVNATNTTTVGTNLAEAFTMNSQNAPQGSLIKTTNTTDVSLQTKVEGSTNIRGVDVKVTNLTNVTTSKVSNTTELSAGKTVSVNNVANVSGAGFVSIKNTSSSAGNQSKTDVGVKASVTYTPTNATNILYNPAAGSTVTQTFKMGFTVDKH